MRYELKITLPIYKIVYSIAFMVIIVLVSPNQFFQWDYYCCRTKCCVACRRIYGR